MGGSLEFSEIENIIKFYPNPEKYLQVFVETGTYKGETTFKMAKKFKQVYTCEIHNGLLIEACKKAQNLGIENINKLKLLNKLDFEKSIGFKLLKQTFLITFHPVTLENSTAEDQFVNLLSAIKKYPNTTYLFTMPNADNDGRVIINLIQTFVANNKNTSIAMAINFLPDCLTLNFILNLKKLTIISNTVYEHNAVPVAIYLIF